MSILYRNIPTLEEDGTWGYTRFETKEEFREFVKNIFKVPGEYKFDETSFRFNEHARTFLKKGIFTDAPRESLDYIDYWDGEREKCRKGCIFKGKNGQVWYLPRFYYHWINFLQIYNKLHKKFEFADIRDVQYHMALYEILAELHDENNAVVKKRQIASSYFHIAKIYNKYIFEEGYVGKIFASDKKYINAANGSWKFLNQYHNFTNKFTAWACGNAPDKEFSWQQKVETKTPDGRKVEIGTMASITGITLDKDPVSGVGGACDEAFYEEGGIAPTADTTYGYMRAALEEGAITTGIFTIAGSVGDLKQCEPLRKFMFHPEANSFYAVDTDLIDEHGTKGRTALFIPEQWGMPPFIDEFGNSKVKDALEFLDKKFAKMKETLSPEEYQLQVSQKPRNLKEAFAMRTVSFFPVQHTSSQIQRIEENEYAYEYVNLIRNQKNEIEMVSSERKPINEFPLPMKTEDKRSIVVIHERPIKGAPVNSYVAVIDPVEVGKTQTSASLASVIVYKMDLEVVTEEYFNKVKPGKEGVDIADEWGALVGKKKRESTQDVKITTHLEGGKIVAFWCGRFDDPNETNEYISRLLELYKARGLSENNKPGFINYMISKKRQKYLVYREEMIFDREMATISGGHQVYGISMTPRLWKKVLEDAINSLSEVLYEEKDENGHVIKVHYGVERITDIMILKEMQLYQPGLNVDRLITYALLISYVKILQAAGMIRKKVDRINENLENPSKSVKLNTEERSMFKNLGHTMGQGQIKQKTIPRSPFRNIR